MAKLAYSPINNQKMYKNIEDILENMYNLYYFCIDNIPTNSYRKWPKSGRLLNNITKVMQTILICTMYIKHEEHSLYFVC